MKKILTVLLVAVSLFCGCAYADGFAGGCDSVPKFAKEAVESQNIGQLGNAQELANFCIAQYAGASISAKEQMERMKLELNADPNNKAVRRLYDEAEKATKMYWETALLFQESRNIIISVSRNLQARKALEALKTGD